ncbi:hypothetical protein CLV80_110129 [Yoonia maritima]|uniref:Transferrin-binding protein B C-lobe/N-lobe beta barrel domain-containing protein n=1 Tax=Yoonia maritima TaxID=1435347 RepID=A0A2T0VWN0_9RHOB|nr:hypothetical protein [Yoonia maritima]PRY76043.1 hypothetical protein CLV80_110129 [Yoonia maritima]
MAYTRGLLIFISSLSLAACEDQGFGEGNTPSASIVTLSDEGEIPDQNYEDDDGSGSHSDLSVVGTALTGYAYSYGLVDGTTNFVGVAGIAPASDPGDAITTGTVSYEGTYALTHVDQDSETFVTGDITLIAAFDTGSVTGDDGALVVTGNFSGTNLGGTVTYEDLTANLDGVVGTDAVVGAFAGNDSESLVVGGIIANTD